MNPLNGDLNVPRVPEFSRKAGDVVVVKVLSKTGPDRWLVQTPTQKVEIRTASPLQIGMVLNIQLRDVGTTAKFTQAAVAPFPGPAVPLTDQFPLSLPAFLRQGLPLIPERLAALERWLRRSPANSPAEKSDWGVAREARGWPDNGPADAALESWMRWETDLLQGNSRQPPENEGFWDLWNSSASKGSGHWMVCPFQWECDGNRDWALLKAFSPNGSSRITQWSVTAAPGATPIRVRAQSAGPAWSMDLQILEPTAFELLKNQWSQVRQACAATDPTLELRLSGPNDGPAVPDSPKYSPGVLNEHR